MRSIARSASGSSSTSKMVPGRPDAGIGSVVTGRLEGEYLLIAGVPAKPLKPLGEEDRFLVEHKTRPDMPDDL